MGHPVAGLAPAAQKNPSQCHSLGPSLLSRPGVNTPNPPFPGISEGGDRAGQEGT